SQLLPPPNDVYISPALYHQLYQQGIVIKDIRHSFFTHSQLPPQPGQTQVHQFDSQVDVQLSTDGGQTYHPARVPGAVTIEATGDGGGDYDTETTQVDLAGGDFGSLRIRESPTLPSRGGTKIELQSDGTYRIHSFFDVFTELSTDGGQSWSAALSGPAHVEL